MSFWRKEVPEFDDKGRITTGGMFEHQLEWWNKENAIKVLVTGYGGGKTLIGGKWSTAMALENAPSPHLCVSPSYKIAKRTIIPTIIALLDGKKTLHRGLWYKYHKTDHEFTIKYKGRTAIIWVGSGDDPDSLKGPNIGSALIDEPFIQDKEVFLQVLARVRDPMAVRHGLGLTGTPEQLNWGYDVCEGDEKDNYDIGIVHASTRANLALKETYANTLEKAFSEKAAEAYVDGKFVDISTGIVYYGFNRNVNIVRLEDPGGALGVGMDFNVDPMAAVVFWVKGKHMHVIDEIELPNADTEYMCSYLIDNFSYVGENRQGECRIENVFPDASGNARSTKAPGGKSDFHYIKSAGFAINAPHANPLVRDRENAVNGKLSPAIGDATLTIDPRCKKLISYLIRYNHAKKNKQKQMSHLLDAFGYPVHRLFPIVRPKIETKRLLGT